MPINYKHYHPEWKTRIVPAILARAGDHCEGSAAYPDCRAANYQPHPMTGSKVILTIAHLDHDVTRNDPDNLRALCQRCHLAFDRDLHHQHARATRHRKKTAGQGSLWPCAEVTP